MSRTIDKMIRERTRIERAMTSAPANGKPRAGEHLPIPATYIIRRGARLTECEAERDQLRMREKELVEALEAATKALEYCAVEPRLLHPLNNSPHAVAMNALPSLHAALSKVRGA